MYNSRRKEIRIKADSFRETCKVSRYGILDLFRECDRCGYKLLRYPLGEDADLGFVMKKDADTVIFTNSSSRLTREIFTLAHEIGHAVLHMEGNVPFIDNTATISGKSVDEREQEANYFAACLLMPAGDVAKFFDLEMENFEIHGLTAMDIARIMSEFHVSFDMALNRLENLGRIDHNGRIRIDNERNLSRVGNLLRSVGGSSRLNEPSLEICIPYEYIDYVIYNYNHNAIPLETLERSLEYYKLSMDDIRDRLRKPVEDRDDLDDLIGGLVD